MSRIRQSGQPSNNFVLVVHPGEVDGPGSGDLAVGRRPAPARAQAPSALPGRPLAAAAPAAGTVPATALPTAPAVPTPAPRAQVERTVLQAQLPRPGRGYAATLDTLGTLTGGVLGAGTVLVGAGFSAIAAARMLGQSTGAEDQLGSRLQNPGALLATGLALATVGGSAFTMAAYRLMGPRAPTAAQRAIQAQLEMMPTGMAPTRTPRRIAPMTQAIVERGTAHADPHPGQRATGDTAGPPGGNHAENSTWNGVENGNERVPMRAVEPAAGPSGRSAFHHPTAGNDNNV